MMRFPNNFHPTPRHFRPRFPVNDGQYPQGPRNFLRPPGHHHFHPPPPRHIGPRGIMPPQHQQPTYGGPPSHCREPGPGMHSGQPLGARSARGRGRGAPNRYHHQNYHQLMHTNAPQFPSGNPFHEGHDDNQRCQRFEGPNHTRNQQHPKSPSAGVRRDQVHTQNGKKKKAKEPKEVDYSHYCDVCDRGFKSAEQFQAHVAEHVQCKAKDCRFFGHPKVVKLHFKMQHGPGAKTINWLDTPEDIKKWREDRKRNFPTAANIARKREQEERKRARGDVLETKQFGKMKRGGGQRGRGRGRGQHWGQRQHPGQVNSKTPVQSSGPVEMQEEIPTKKQKMEDTSQHSSSLLSDPKKSSVRHSTDEMGDDQVPPQARPADRHTKDNGDHPDCDPLSLLAENEGSGDEDATVSQGTGFENQNVAIPAIEVAPKGTVGALGSLAISYNSDTSEDSDTESAGNANTDVAPSQTREQPNSREAVLTIAKAELAVDGGTGLQSGGHTQGGRRTEQRKQRRQRRSGTTSKADPSHIPSKRRKATLLEMLLAPEIRRERNTILQCVRYIVKNDFFQGADADT